MMFRDRSQTHFLEALFRDRVVPVGAVRTPEDFWDFVDGKVAPILQGDNLTGTPAGTLFGNLKTPTGVRIRQIRVPETSCARTAARMEANNMIKLTKCYASLGISNIETTFLLADGSVPEGVPASVSSAYAWSSEKESDEIVQLGSMGLYPASGFLIDSKDASQLLTVASVLRSRQWVDVKTRVVFVDFEVYIASLDIWLSSYMLFIWLASNMFLCLFLFFVFFYFIKVYSANLDIWLTSRTIFEWLPSGVVIVLQQVRGVYLDRYKFDGAWDYVQVSLEFLVAFMMVWHLIQEVVELCARGVSSYVRSFWNMVLRIILCYHYHLLSPLSRTALICWAIPYYCQSHYVRSFWNELLYTVATCACAFKNKI
jgi:hypothetical protein